jgi:protein involved in polysaccharide export with SLBB domain
MGAAITRGYRLGWALALAALFRLESAVAGEIHAVIESGSAVTNLAAAANMETLDDKRKLGLGDRVSFRIVEDREEPRSLIVTDSGDVEAPYIGRFSAVDKTCKQLAWEIKVELEKEYYYEATVIIALDFFSRSRGKVYLVGSIRSPGPQEIPADETFTLSKAIMRAGGFGEFADKKRVKVTRKGAAPGSGNQVLTVNLVEVIEKGKADKDLDLEPGDLIYIPSRVINL